MSGSTMSGSKTAGLRETVSPTVPELEQDDSEAISALLASRRRLSLFTRRSSRKDAKRRQSAASRLNVDAEEEEDDLKGQLSYMAAANAHEEQRVKALPKPTALIANLQSHTQTQDRGSDHDKTIYVWDILYENQRGIYLFGRANFSSNALLPADPTPITIPPIAESSRRINHRKRRDIPFVRSGLDENSRDHRARWYSAHAQDALQSIQSYEVPEAPKGPRKLPWKPINTGFTLTTYESPSPAWEWVTPWMVNMSVGTDEAGWRYNWIFRRHGWKPSTRYAGWGGWVRRREWIRLRRLEAEDKEAESWGVRRSRHKVDRPFPRSLQNVFDKGNGLDEIVKISASIHNDRERLEQWTTWMNEADQRERDEVQAILDNKARLHTLLHTMTYQTNALSLIDLLTSHNLKVSPEAAAIPYIIPSPDTTPRPSRASSPEPTSRSISTASFEPAPTDKP